MHFSGGPRSEVQIDREATHSTHTGQCKNKHVNFDLTNSYIQYDNKGHIIQKNTGSLIENKLCYSFYSNVTSLSNHAQEYIFSISHYINILAIVETHKEDEYVKNKFANNGYNVSPNPPADLSTGGTHGGELIATKTHLQTKRIPQSILQHISHEFGETRFAA